jgi:hypothetical protein
MVFLIIAGITLTTLAAGVETAVLSGYRPTYTPNANDYNSPEPVQLGKFRDSMPAQLSSGNAKGNRNSPIAELSPLQVKEEFMIVGDSNEPIPDAQLKGSDGSGNDFLEFTDRSGYVAVNGTPGDWQFTAYASGYFTKTWDRRYADNTHEVLVLQKMDAQQLLDENRPKDESVPRKTIVLDGCDFNKTIEQGSDPAKDDNYLGDEG